MQYAVTPPARRPNHLLRWLLAVVAILEIAAFALLLYWAYRAAPCVAARTGLGGSGTASLMSAGSEPATNGAANADAGTGSNGSGAVPPVAEPGAASLPSADAGASSPAADTAAPAAPAAEPGAAATTGAQAANDAAAAPAPQTSGSLNDVVDPNCVAKSAAALLTSGTPASGPTATCGAMKAPAELKAAVKQMQQLTGGQSK